MGVKQRRIKQLLSVTTKFRIGPDDAAQAVQPEGAQRQSHTNLGGGGAKRTLWKRHKWRWALQNGFSRADMGAGETGRSIPGRDTSVSKDLEEGNFIQSR